MTEDEKREYRRLKTKRWREKNPEKALESARRSMAKKRAKEPGHWRRASYLYYYGITVAQYDEMHAAQGGVCVICSRVCKTGRRLSIDHDHLTGAIRGLLCKSCNMLVGHLERSETAAALAYLLRWRNIMAETREPIQ